MKSLHLLLCAAALALLAGCTTNVNTVSRAEPAGAANVIQDKRVVTDKTLAEKVSVVQVAEGVASSNLSRIQVTLANNRSRALNVSYSFEWFDMNGMLLPQAGGGWKSVRLQGMEQKVISSVAPSPQAVDFILKLQEPN